MKMGPPASLQKADHVRDLEDTAPGGTPIERKRHALAKAASEQGALSWRDLLVQRSAI